MTGGDDNDTSRPIELTWNPSAWLDQQLPSGRPIAPQVGSDPMERRDFLTYLAALTGGAALPDHFLERLGAQATLLGQLQMTTDFLRAQFDRLDGRQLQRLWERHADQVEALVNQASSERARLPLLAVLAEARGEAGSNACYNLGDHRVATDQFDRALEAAIRVDQPGLDQWIMAMQANQFAFLDQPDSALDLLDAASYLAGDPCSRASIATYYAGVHAFAGHEAASVSALDSAAELLDQVARDGTPAPRWLSGRKPEMLQAVRGLCLLQVGRPAAAARVLRQLLRSQAFAPDSGRHAIVTVDLGCAYADLDEPRSAALHGLEAFSVVGPLGLGGPLRSPQRRQRFGRLDRRLANPRFAGVGEVAEFRHRVARLVA